MTTPVNAEVAINASTRMDSDRGPLAAAETGCTATPPGGVLTVTLAEAAQLRELAAEASQVARRAAGIAYQLRRLLGDPEPADGAQGRLDAQGRELADLRGRTDAALKRIDDAQKGNP